VPNLDESIKEVRQIADGRNDILAEAAGITAGSWYASPATHVGSELRLIVLAAIETVAIALGVCLVLLAS
jgi:hypothetical protein